MDLFALLIAKNLGELKTRALLDDKRASQLEPALPPIDCGLLAEVCRVQNEEARREEKFLAGTAIRATA
jgi:hypothetical protein